MNAADVLPVPPNGVTAREVRLAALPSAVPWARRVLQHVLRERQLETLADPALLLVSELVTNAVQASARGVQGDPDRVPVIALSLQVTGTSLVAEVWDASPAVPALRDPDLTADGGRGLVLVDCLADVWGHRRANDGKVVWCKISLPHSDGSGRRGITGRRESCSSPARTQLR
jgi:anti-sigma regulatory factor (Ser/Thr protein kinase)